MVVIVLMGVCGSGKTTVAEKLATKLQCSFKDADDFHTVENKKKMSSGIPLTDQDRIPWLFAIHDYIKSLIQASQTGVVTCSALRQIYRNILVEGNGAITTPSTIIEASQVPSKTEDILFVYLKGAKEVIRERLLNRLDHFMSPTLLDSQLETLEEPCEPERYFMVNVDKSVEEIVDSILKFSSLCHLV
ncbi:hypothetical protein EGW08_018697 [Elysia chlorotica]|uniref:Gluconokinase n=1 Tax=Elysia chlorotica TaxID=188477 RepID=A0A3S0ZRF6_ELYCH|nr:hypothetical protein EGW08_018697 [Elysia chlorotica]